MASFEGDMTTLLDPVRIGAWNLPNRERTSKGVRLRQLRPGRYFAFWSGSPKMGRMSFTRSK